MSVSKRLRFEILKRDGFVCRYCGRGRGEVRLHVDHIVPRALGGSDDPSNLVAACSDCNGGKAAVPLGVSQVPKFPIDVLVDTALRAARRYGELQAAEAEELQRGFAGEVDWIDYAFPLGLPAGFM